MKTLKNFVYTFFVLLLMSGCSASLPLDYGDWIIYGGSDIYSVKNNNDTLQVTGNISRPKGDQNLWFYNNLFFESEEAYYVKTSADRERNVWLEKIDKDTLETVRVKHTSIDSDCALLTEDYFYVVSNFMDHLEIDMYDLNLSLEKTVSFSFKENVNLFPTDLIEYDNDIYMICGVIENDFDYGYTKNYLFRLNKDFDLIQYYDLNEQDGAFYDSVVVDDTLYLAQTKDGFNTDQGWGSLDGNEIWCFDLKEQRLLEKKIVLQKPGPCYITFDASNRNLIIEHSENGYHNHVWTIYNVDTGTETVFPVDVSMFSDDFQQPANFSIQGSKYYFLFSEFLYEYDINTMEYKTYRLSDYHIDGAVLILFHE